MMADLPIQQGLRYETFFGLDKAVAAALLTNADDDEAAAFDDFAQRAESRRAATRDRLNATIDDKQSRADQDLAAAAELTPTITDSGRERRRESAALTRRAGARHVALDDPEDETYVAGASIDGLFLEIRVR